MFFSRKFTKKRELEWIKEFFFMWWWFTAYMYHWLNSTCKGLTALALVPTWIVLLLLLYFIYLFIYLFIIIIIIILFVVDFVIHWNETAMGLHVFPILIPPPTSLCTRSL